MGHIVGHNDFHLICNKDLDCNTKILNSYCDHNITIDRNSSCSCEKGYKYYSKFNKCIFSNHFRCTTAKQCANLDPRLTCIDNFCTCKEREKRVDNYLCNSFKKYCYKGYRYNVETTDCVFVGDLTLNNQENLDQSVEIFVIVLFFITAALFIASCINNYKNERREKTRRRLLQQQTMSLFAEQQRRSNFLTNSNSITEVVNLANDNLFLNNQLRYDTSRNNRHYRHPNMFDYHKTNNTTLFDDLPPSYEDVMKNEGSKYYTNDHQVITVNNLTISNETNSQSVSNNNSSSLSNNQQSDECLGECITNVRITSENNTIDNLINNCNTSNDTSNDLNNNMQTVNNDNLIAK